MSIPCRAGGCTDTAEAKGMCPKHYMRMRRHGDTETVGKSGRPKDPRLTHWRNALGDAMSERNLSRWSNAIKIIGVLDGQEAVAAAVQAATRKNGSLNVSVVVRASEVAVFRALIDGRISE
jgi:hypothetical protein